MACFFCDQSHETIYEDDRCFAMLHEDSAVRGHVMVVSRQHVQNVSDLHPSDAVHFFEVYTRVERAVLAVTGRERAIMLKLGIQAAHLHLHIYPVSQTATREEVQAAIDARVREEREDDLTAKLRRALQ